MGIQGLLPLLKSIQKPTHLRNFAGQTLGIDAYGWLHRGTVSCAIELAQQKPTRKHIDFALSRVRMLIDFGVKPYMVFDGDYLPSKAHTEKERASRRKESKKMGLELLAMGRPAQAYLELQKAIDVTPSMARELIEELKRMDVPYVVAPYEADSQLAYLEKQGVIDGVLSEDSDLLVFGVNCLLTKLDQYGECVMVNRKHFTACREVSLVGWSDVEFRMMAMLSGCDYLPGIERMGLKTAYRLVRKHKTLDRVIRTAQFDGKMKVPAGYLEAFTKAERTFLYQWVFCPEARCLVNLNPLPAGLEAESLPYIGKDVPAELAVGVAVGDLDPNSKEPLPVPHRNGRQPFARTRPAQTPDEKHGKTIEEFFKPKRTPLAELDPNSFTPSPSQQRLLEDQRSTSWSASQAQPLRPQALARVASTHAPSSAPHPARRTMSAPLSDRQRASPKRQRLCADGVVTASTQSGLGLPQTTSRFFSKQPAQASPSLRKASSKKRDDFELWSDDSIAEAAAELAATQEGAVAGVAPKSGATPSPKKRKKLQVFVDVEKDRDLSQPGGHAVPADTSQESLTTVATAHSQSQIDGDTPATSFEVSQGQSTPTVFSKGVASEFAALRSKFSFEPKRGVSRTKSAPLASQGATEYTAQNLADNRTQAPAKADQHAQRHLGSPPLRDGAGSEDEPTVVPASSPIAGASPVEAEGEIDDEQWLALERESVPRSQQHTLDVQGSEDMLVPNSPDSGPDNGRTRPKIDFGRFAFAG